MTNYLLIGAIAYFFGAIPFSFLIGLVFYRTDIRKHGSGNIGSTNLYRVLGPLPGITGYLLDTIKGVLSVLILVHLFPTDDPNLAGIIAACLAIIGHMFPIYLLFKGGKGVAVAFGACLVLSPWAALCSILLFAITVLIWRYISLGSLVGTMSFIIFSSLYSYFFESHFNYWLLGYTIALGLLVIIAHRSNIKRLIKGEEGRFDFKRKKSKA
jgi:glycerol-3-phosphate acyltransferase PlsY